MVGGAFLCYLGVKTFVSAVSAPAQQSAQSKGSSLASAYTSTFFLTLTNPATILSFAAVFAGLGLTSTDGNYFSAMLLVLGVFAGSALWWLMLSGSIGLVWTMLTSARLKWVNRISGVVITAFGLLALLSLKF